MKITRKSMLSGIERTLDLDITPQQAADYLNGKLIQEAFPNLSADDREFIMTGITPDEWEAQFEDGEDDV